MRRVKIRCCLLLLGGSYAAGASNQITATPPTGPPGATITLGGSVAEGSSSAMVYWDEAGTLQILATITPAPNGSFGLQINVPDNATTGPAKIAVLAAGGDLERDLVSADFRVETAPPGTFQGTVKNAAGDPVTAGVPIRLLDRHGLPVAESRTDATGAYRFGGLPPGRYGIQVLDDGYPPDSSDVTAGGTTVVETEAAGAANFEFPYLQPTSFGAMALPGGSYPGSLPVQVGDIDQEPFARLVSLRGAGLAPLNVRFWVALQRVLLPTNAPLIVVFQLLKKDGSEVMNLVSAKPTVLYPAVPYQFSAFAVDVNSFELVPGSLTLRITAVSVGFTLVGKWEFPVDVIDLGSRWYSGNVTGPKLQVARQDFYRLRYDFSGTMPKLASSPIFQENWDLQLVQVNNSLDASFSLQEHYDTDGGWWGHAKAVAKLELFSQSLIDDQRDFAGPFGAGLESSTYSLDPAFSHTLPFPIEIPVVGVGLPTPVDICGLTFGGALGGFLDLDGSVSLGATLEKDLHPTVTVTPALAVSFPVKAELDAGVCQASAKIEPKGEVQVPLVFDPAASPVVGWKGLCVTFSGTASGSLTCCGFGFSKQFDLFPPIQIGSCAATAPLDALPSSLLSPGAAVVPPRNLSLAVSPAGYALAAWEGYTNQDGVLRRTAPWVSVYDGRQWSDPRPVAGPAEAGMEPRVAFLGDRKVRIVWIRGRSSAATSAPRDARLSDRNAVPQGVCDTVHDVLDLLCNGFFGGIGGFVDGVVSGVEDIFGFSEPALRNGVKTVVTTAWSPPEELTSDDTYDGRPVIAADPRSGETVVVWLKEQPAVGRQQALALYFSRSSGAGWSAAARVDPASQSLDFQPTLRFDRQGTASAVWVRDEDGNANTGSDRQLMFSTLGRAAWTTPERITGVPQGPWTPSLDFDARNRAMVAFVVPARHPKTGELLPADGTLSLLQVARQSDRGWESEEIGGGRRASRPVLRVGPSNAALVFFRSFGVPGRVTPAGQVGVATADLAQASPHWSSGDLSSDDRLHWQVTGEINPVSNEPILAWEERDPRQDDGEPVQRLERFPWLPDLAFASEGIQFSNTRPAAGETVRLVVKVVNRGLKPWAGQPVTVSLYDEPIVRGAQPFATQTLTGPLGFGETATVTATYTAKDRAERTLTAIVDASNDVAESDETHNSVEARFGGLPGPTALVAHPMRGEGAIRLEWRTDVTDDSLQHWILRAPEAGGEFEVVGRTGTTTFTDGSAAAGRAYRYRVVSVDAAGVRSVAKETPAVAWTPDPQRDTEALALQATANGRAATLAWRALPAVQLEETTELGDRSRWTPVTEAVRTVSGVAQVTLPAVQGTAFFRLVKR